MSAVADNIIAYIAEREAIVEGRVKAWLTRQMLVQLVAAVPVIFLLGMIAADGRAGLALLREQAAELDRRGNWMNERERWEQAMETWAVDEGFVPPRYLSQREVNQRRGEP